MGINYLFKFISTHVSLLIHVSGALVVLACLIMICGLLISYFDKKGIEDSLYFAFITAFTVGFGDIVPQTRPARAITVFIALLGLVFAGILVAIAVKALDITFHTHI